MGEPIYKICTQAVWEEALAAGALAGMPVDAADGYIHLSTAAQLSETLDKHFAGQSGLVLLTVDLDRLPHGLKWEPARGGALFPHLYAPLPLAAVLAHRVLEARSGGGFDLPEIG